MASCNQNGDTSDALAKNTHIMKAKRPLQWWSTHGRRQLPVRSAKGWSKQENASLQKIRTTMTTTDLASAWIFTLCRSGELWKLVDYVSINKATIQLVIITIYLLFGLCAIGSTTFLNFFIIHLEQWFPNQFFIYAVGQLPGTTRVFRECFRNKWSA